MRSTTVAQACLLVTDGTHYTPPDVGKGYPFLTVKDMNGNGLDFEGCSHISSQEFERADSGNSAPKKGDVLYSKDGTVGKVHVVKENEKFAVLSSIAILRPNENLLDSDYFAHILKAPSTLAQSVRKKTGSAIRRIILKDLKQVKIPLPPLDEQRRIAAILDKADAVRRKRQEALRLTEDLLRSVFLDMFGDPVTNPKGFLKVTLRDLIDETQYGTSKKAGMQGEYPILRMGNITAAGSWDFDDLKYIDLEKKELDKYLVFKGDILFNRTNSKDLVGKTAVYRVNEPMAYAGYLIRVRPNNKANSEYISAHLNSAFGKATLTHMCKSIVGMANINAQELRTIPVLFPPLEMQNKYAEAVEKILAMKNLLSRALKIQTEIFNSLVQRAFRGEL